MSRFFRARGAGLWSCAWQPQKPDCRSPATLRGPNSRPCMAQKDTAARQRRPAHGELRVAGHSCRAGGWCTSPFAAPNVSRSILHICLHLRTAYMLLVPEVQTIVRHIASHRHVHMVSCTWPTDSWSAARGQQIQWQRHVIFIRDFSC